MQLKNKNIIIITIALTLVAAISRIIPHWPNFTALGAVALFSSAFIGRKYLGLIVPLIALFISDLVLNNLVYAQMYPDYYNGFTFFAAGSGWIYLALIAVFFVGSTMLRKVSIGRFSLAAVGSSVTFFLITNFAAWAGPWAMFPKTAAGLLATFEAGIPFFWNTLGGDLFYGALLFGLYQVGFRATHFTSSTSNEWATNLLRTKK